MDFVHPDNLCGQSLLTLAARGNGIIAELLRLSKHVPPCVRRRRRPRARAGGPRA